MAMNPYMTTAQGYASHAHAHQLHNTQLYFTGRNPAARGDALPHQYNGPLQTNLPKLRPKIAPGSAASSTALTNDGLAPASSSVELPPQYYGPLHTTYGDPYYQHPTATHYPHPYGAAVYPSSHPYGHPQYVHHTFPLPTASQAPYVSVTHAPPVAYADMRTANAFGEGKLREPLVKERDTPNPMDGNPFSSLLASAVNMGTTVSTLWDDGLGGSDRQLHGDEAQYVAFVSAKHNRLDDMDRVLDEGLNPNVIDSSNYTMLMWAARCGAAECALALVKRGAIIDIKPKFESPTPLIIAAKHGSTEVARILLERLADPNLPDSKMHNPLLFAAANGSIQCIKLLLDHGSDPNWTATTFSQHQVVQTKGIDKEFRLHEGTREKIDWQEASAGKTSLQVAARFGHGQVVELLINHDANIAVRDEQGRTALCWAGLGGHVVALRSLLRARADVDSPDEDGNTALMWAVRSIHRDAVDVLVDAGANVNYESPFEKDRTPLTWAIQYADRKMVTQLKRKGAILSKQRAPDFCGYDASTCVVS
eukprot:GEMP01023448.1.p1 GENE.GEMP01023448.1~~GEMP01023448.1.p1  ORF type:complete len:536 (+),score=116.43 GEMP01023448.1:206-1813(+)